MVHCVHKMQIQKLGSSRIMTLSECLVVKYRGVTHDVFWSTKHEAVQKCGSANHESIPPFLGREI
jgi:hypothetical protein